MMVEKPSTLTCLVEARVGDEFAIRSEHMQERFDLAFAVHEACHWLAVLQHVDRATRA